MATYYRLFETFFKRPIITLTYRVYLFIYLSEGLNLSLNIIKFKDSSCATS